MRENSVERMHGFRPTDKGSRRCGGSSMTGAAERVLLTGGSGVLGMALASRLEPTGLVSLVHRDRAVARYGKVVEGDLRQPRLGMEARVHRELAATTTDIIHCAASTSFAARPDVVTATNRETTQRILEFAQHSGARLIHVSTAFVERRDEISRLMARGDAVSDAGRGIAAYVESKAECETLVKASALPSCIVRPSLIGGDAKHGSIAKLQGLHLVAASLLEGRIPIVPVADDCHIDFLPSDTVAGSILHILSTTNRAPLFRVTAGAEALTVLRMLDLTQQFATERGMPFDRPPVVSRGTLERLILPAFLEQIPRASRRRLAFLVGLLSLFVERAPFRTSLGDTLPGLSKGLEDAYITTLSFLHSRGPSELVAGTRP